MPEQVGELKITHAFEGAEGSAVGGAGLDTEKSKAAAQKGQEPDKKKTNVFKKIGGILAGVLGIQVSFAAMLRQSQIATGFLGAVFQVLGAILDSFLLAFAPMLFRMVQDLARLIPIARAFGETIAAEIVGVVDVVKIMTERVMPVLVGIWEWIMAAYKFISELNPLIKRLLIYAFIGSRLFNFFGGGLFAKILYQGVAKAMLWALAKSKAKEAGVGMAKAAGKMLMMIPHARIIMIALAVVAVVGTAIWAIFKPKKDKNESGALDISGQIGKSYLPSQASQLGGTLNEAYSAIIEPFTSNVTPQFVEAAEVMSGAALSFGAGVAAGTGIIGEAARTANETITQKFADMGIYIDEYGTGIAGLDAMNGKIVGASGIVVEDFGKIGVAAGLLVDETGLTQIGLDSMRAAYDANLRKDVEATKEHQRGIKTATDGWVGDILEATGLQIGGYGTLTTGTDAMANTMKLAGEKYDEKVMEAGATWVKGADQAKNQWVSTASILAASGTEMSAHVTQVIAKGEMDRAMGSLSGTMIGLSDYIATIYEQDAKALAEAALEQKKATIAFQEMSASVQTGYEADRARREQERTAEAMNFEGLGKFFDYMNALY